MTVKFVPIKVSLPILVTSGIIILLSLVLCCYLKSLQKKIRVEQGYKISSYKPRKSASCEACAICLDDFQPMEKIVVSRCQHSFHNKCLERWLEVKNSCPICLAPIKKITTQDDATLTPNCSVIVITSSNTATLDHVINNHIHPINTCQMNNNMTCSNGRNLSPVTITSILFNSNESKSCQTNDNVINIMDSANVTSNGSGRNLANDLPLPNVNNIQIFTPSQYPQQASKIINNSFSPSSSNIKSANIVYHVSTSNDLAISPEKLVSKSQNVMSFNLNDKHLLYPVLTDRQASSDVLGIRDNKYKGFYFSSSTKNNNSTTKYQKHDKGVLLMHNEDFLEAKNENSIPKNGNDFFRISSQPNFMDVYQYSEVAQSSSSPFSVSSYDFTQKLPEI